MLPVATIAEHAVRSSRLVRSRLFGFGRQKEVGVQCGL